MIEVHRLNNSAFFINHKHIETMEAIPDTVITLVNEKKYVVKEAIPEIISRIQAFEAAIVRYTPGPA
ncbi:MAG: flagellar FlbD family protein [Leptospirales bacterium]|nr:flagellar FlbD family protein [Leptospirales bacterium]